MRREVAVDVCVPAPDTDAPPVAIRSASALLVAAPDTDDCADSNTVTVTSATVAAPDTDAWPLPRRVAAPLIVAAPDTDVVTFASLDAAAMQLHSRYRSSAVMRRDTR